MCSSQGDSSVLSRTNMDTMETVGQNTPKVCRQGRCNSVYAVSQVLGADRIQQMRGWRCDWIAKSTDCCSARGLGFDSHMVTHNNKTPVPGNPVPSPGL